MTHKNGIVEAIGRDSFEWLSREFDKRTALKDIPDDILYRIAAVDMTIRDYVSDKNAVTSIAVITFAYKMADKVQQARFGAKDILLLKVLARKEKSRREGKGGFNHAQWDLPLFELITGEVGDRIRAIRTINSPI
ncbi:MAG: hypothetical protein JRH04_15790 [Deltaproteobacteria bacterium]|nr:hypothetical protein [Deltaproteobacteria bacterium]